MRATQTKRCLARDIGSFRTKIETSEGHDWSIPHFFLLLGQSCTSFLSQGGPINGYLPYSIVGGCPTIRGLVKGTRELLQDRGLSQRPNLHTPRQRRRVLHGVYSLPRLRLPPPPPTSWAGSRLRAWQQRPGATEVLRTGMIGSSRFPPPPAPPSTSHGLG